MRAYKDLEGTKLAEPGDRVALILGPHDHQEFYQSEVNKRPVLRDYSPLFNGTKTLGVELIDEEIMSFK